MTKETKRMVLDGLSRLRGDDYERAERAFRQFTPTEMADMHGESGQTRQQILNGYRDHVKAVEAAVTEVKALHVAELEQREARLREALDGMSLILAPEPPPISNSGMASLSPLKARRDWWREGYSLGARAVADELATLLQSSKKTP